MWYVVYIMNCACIYISVLLQRPLAKVRAQQPLVWLKRSVLNWRETPSLVFVNHHRDPRLVLKVIVLLFFITNQSTYSNVKQQMRYSAQNKKISIKWGAKSGQKEVRYIAVFIFFRIPFLFSSMKLWLKSDVSSAVCDIITQVCVCVLLTRCSWKGSPVTPNGRHWKSLYIKFTLIVSNLKIASVLFRDNFQTFW